MKPNNIDEKIIELLRKETEIDHALQEETWEKITKRLNKGKREEKRPKRRKWLAAISVAALILLVVIGSLTEPGQAMIRNIKDRFVTEKEIEIDIEGQKESSNVQLEMNEQLNYVIYLDEDHYRKQKVDDLTRIVPKEPLGEAYPDVYMIIRKQDGASVDKIINDIKEELTQDSFAILDIQQVTEPIKSTMIYATENSVVEDGELMHLEWDTPMKRYYIVPTDQDTSFIIEQLYFSEAEEGHGVRLDKMLESFEIIEN